MWASCLPLDTTSPTAYRVLVLLANHAHSDGRNVWRKNSDMAKQLGCSLRTIERAVRDLRVMGLIKNGDQRLTEHLRGDRRPTVYDLNFSFNTDYGPAPELSYEPTTGDGSHGPTILSRTDETVPNGPTTAVAHRTVIEPSISSYRGNHRRKAGPCGHQLVDDRHCTHGCPIPKEQDA